MRIARWLALALAVPALTGCETTAEKSARLQRQAKRVIVSESGLSITRSSAQIEVLNAIVVRDSERAAAVVTLRNRSDRAERGVPIAITVKDARGRALFDNSGPGLESALVSVPSIGPRSTISWVDDQLPPAGAPASVDARVGEASNVSGNLPKIAVGATRLTEDPANGVLAIGSVANASPTPQTGLVLFAVALRAGRIVAAGRAIVPELAAHASAPFQAALVGQPHGAQLRIAAPPIAFK